MKIETEQSVILASSTSLHAGTWSYVHNVYSSDNIMSVIIKPENIMSVPVDYNGQKLRCCEYLIEDIQNNPKDVNSFNKLFN